MDLGGTAEPFCVFLVYQGIVSRRELVLCSVFAATGKRKGQSALETLVHRKYLDAMNAVPGLRMQSPSYGKGTRFFGPLNKWTIFYALSTPSSAEVKRTREPYS